MAETRKKEVKEETVNKQAVDEGPKYTVQELIDASREIFGQPREVVVVAISAANKKLTVEEARNLVEKFLKKEVK